MTFTLYSDHYWGLWWKEINWGQGYSDCQIWHSLHKMGPWFRCHLYDNGGETILVSLGTISLNIWGNFISQTHCPNFDVSDLLLAFGGGVLKVRTLKLSRTWAPGKAASAAATVGQEAPRTRPGIFLTLHEMEVFYAGLRATELFCIHELNLCTPHNVRS